MIFIEVASVRRNNRARSGRLFHELSLRRHVRQERHGARLLDRMRELTLMPRAAAGDPPRDDLAPLGDEVPQPAHVLVVDQVNPVRAELADLAAAEAAPLHRLLRGRNGSALLLAQNGTSSSLPPPGVSSPNESPAGTGTAAGPP